MTQSGRTDWGAIGCAAVLAAAIAFPAGLFVGRSALPPEGVREAGRPAPSGGRSRTSRNVYSPRIGSDPYVIDQQREVVRALEASCRQSRRHCPEAEQARRRIEEAEAAR